MDIWHEIESLGFYPVVVARSLRRGLAGADPLATLCQLDAAFDRGTMFRHLTVAALTPTQLVQVHVDELEDGGAIVQTALAPLSGIRGASVMELVAQPATDPASTPTEVTVSVDLGGQRRAEMEPRHCDDPECSADHGYAATSFPDDLAMRVSSAADGDEALARAEHFVDVLTALIGGAR